jgi:hypothetical protein
MNTRAVALLATTTATHISIPSSDGISTRVYIYIYIYIYTHARTYAHTHIHTYTWLSTHWSCSLHNNRTETEVQKARAMNMAEMQSFEWQLQEMTDNKNEEWNSELQQWRQTVQLAASQLPPVMHDYHSLPQDPYAYPHNAAGMGGGNGGVGAGASQSQMFSQRMQRSHDMMQQHMMRQVRRIASVYV